MRVSGPGVLLALAVLQQLTGVNAIIDDSNSIFAAAGFATPAEQAQALGRSARSTWSRPSSRSPSSMASAGARS